MESAFSVRKGNLPSVFLRKLEKTYAGSYFKSITTVENYNKTDRGTIKMSFKAFVSYFVGVIAMLLGSKYYIQSRSVFLLILLLVGGFCISQIVSFVIHMYCKLKNEIENPPVLNQNQNFGTDSSSSRSLKISSIY